MTFVKKTRFTPTQILSLGVITIILIGTLFLAMPIATADGQGAPLLTAVFTATSATCVTGLVVVDTEAYFSIFGQIVILLLIQVGGLGFMTFATLFALVLGKKITLKDRILLQEALQKNNLQGVVRLARQVLVISLLIEGLGALLLSLRFAQESSWAEAIYFGVFHSVSSFNNAGFNILGGAGGLMSYTDDPVINLIMVVLIIVGGLGFVVLSELFVHKGNKYSLHSLVVLKGTIYLVFIATMLIFLLEFTNPLTIGELNIKTKLLASFFQGAAARTAGFNTIPFGDLRTATQLLFIVLMFIGAAPGSTGGGIKITTFLTVLLYIRASYKGKCQTTIMERTLPSDLIQKAIILTFMAGIMIFGVSALLTITESADYLSILFETTSAFAIVGLSLGLTPELSMLGKIIIIITMYIGRVGPLTLVYAFAKKRQGALAQVKFPEERILIG